MTDHELDQLLNRWRTPEPSSSLRRRVVGSVPEREPRRFGRPMRWVLAAAVASGLLVAAMAQNGQPALGNIAQGIHDLHDSMFFWLDDHWVGHILSAFRHSNLKVYVDGQLVPDAECGGSGGMVWVQLPGEGRYEVVLRRPPNSTAPRAGRFHGHNLEFLAGGRSVRIESDRSVGMGTDRGVFLREPAGR